MLKRFSRGNPRFQWVALRQIDGRGNLRLARWHGNAGVSPSVSMRSRFPDIRGRRQIQERESSMLIAAFPQYSLASF